MAYESLLLWTVIAVAVAVGAWWMLRLPQSGAPGSSVRDSARADLERQNGPSRPAALWGADGADDSAATAFANSVRSNAEEAARAVADGEATRGRNPFAEGTRDYVLWLTSYHLALAQLQEQRQDQADSVRN